MFEVIMIDSHCPEETCSLGLHATRELAENAILIEQEQYSKHMIFKIEEKYVQ
jgi:hypothetical protein